MNTDRVSISRNRLTIVLLAAILLLLSIGREALAVEREYRRQTASNTHLLIFVHGFTGHYNDTWAEFPNLILDDTELTSYDVLMWGYPSNKLGGNPDIAQVGRYFKTEIDYLHANYNHVVIAAHSMGGLVVREMIVKALMQGRRDDLTKVKQIILYGTPNEGINKANYVPPAINKQIANMRTSSDFIVDLRKQWLEHVYRADNFPGQHHLAIPTTAIAGVEDRFVPKHSVSTFFPDYETVAGDHTSMVKPENNQHLSFRILRTKMLKRATLYDAPLSATTAKLVQKSISVLEKQLSAKDDQLAAKEKQLAEAIKAITALAKANEQPDAVPEIEAALLSLSRGNTEQAELVFQAIADAGRIDTKNSADAHRYLGALAFYRGDVEKSLVEYQRATELYKVIGNKEELAIIYGNMSYMHEARDELDIALKRSELALGIFREMGDNEGIAHMYFNMGKIYRKLRDPESAIAIHTLSQTLYEQLGNTEGNAISYFNIGAVHYDRKEWDLARSAWNQSQSLYKNIKSTKQLQLLAEYMKLIPE